MFPELPKNLEALTDEELLAAKSEFQAIAAKAKARDPETVGDLTQDEVVEALEGALASVKAIDAIVKERADAETTFEAELNRLGSEFGVTDEAEEETAPAGDDPDEGDAEGDAADENEAEVKEEQPEAVAASAAPKLRRPLPAAKRRQRPSAEELDDGSGLRAGVESFALNIDRGERISSDTLHRLMAEMVKKNRVPVNQRIVVASVSHQFPEDRQLGLDGDSNAAKIEAVTGQSALVASGGLCAPLEPVYDLPGVETASRPVRDALTGFQANRGGVIVGTNPTMGSYTDAVGTVTAENDELGGTFAVKDCMRIECPDFTEVEVNAVYRCIEAGNLTARAYPELMARIDTLVSAEHARLGDTLLLDALKAGSTAVTDPNTTATAGAMWKLLGYVHAAAAGMRNRHRMSDAARLRVLFPEWLIDLLVVDLARNGNDSDRFKTRDQIEAILGRAGINVTFYKDGPSTGTAQVFGAQSAGNLLGWPDAVQFPLYPEGSWLHLDSGQLDLGIVRDSTLNSTNDFQIFAETWENAAFVGVESQWHTATIFPNGTNSAPKDFSAATDF